MGDGDDLAVMVDEELAAQAVLLLLSLDLMPERPSQHVSVVIPLRAVDFVLG
jgi:hypothetical protein